MKKILYIGNKRTTTGLNLTTIDTLSAQLQAEGFQVTVSSSKKNKLFRLMDMVKSVFKNADADFVLIDTYSTSAFWYAFIVSQCCRISKKKYIPILHGGNLPNRLKLSPFFSKLIFKNAFRNVAPSNYLLHEFEKEGYTNVVCIPNSLDLDKYVFKQRDCIAPRILWVRAFASIYNPKMAVDVLYQLKKKYPQASLCMVGPDKDGTLTVTQTYAKKHDLNVTFTGKLSKKDWLALSSEYDVFINTTHFDNTPVSVMEALALGLPVVSTNVGGLPYLVKDTEDALLVPDGNVFLMTKSIETLLQNPELAQKLSCNGRNKAQHWDWKTLKNQWITLLKA